MKIYFSHGKESGPKGQKIQILKGIALKNGFNTLSVDYTGITNPEERVEKLAQTLSKERDNGEIVFVGSSMGAYVSLAAAERFPHIGVFLMAPAVYLEGYQKQSFPGDYKNLEIVHGWGDKSVPVENVIAFSKEKNCLLHLVHDGHRLANSHENIGVWFDLFLKRIAQPEREDSYLCLTSKQSELFRA